MARRRGQAARTSACPVDKMEYQAIFFRGEVQQPDEVGNREEKPAGAESLLCHGGCEEAVCAADGEDERHSEEGC